MPAKNRGTYSFRRLPVLVAVSAVGRTRRGEAGELPPKKFQEIKSGDLHHRGHEAFPGFIIQKSEWSDPDARHGRLSREGSGRARREMPRYKSNIEHQTSDIRNWRPVPN
jgi:hypothetical protein